MDISSTIIITTQEQTTDNKRLKQKNDYINNNVGCFTPSFCDSSTIMQINKLNILSCFKEIMSHVDQLSFKTHLMCILWQNQRQFLRTVFTIAVRTSTTDRGLQRERGGNYLKYSGLSIDMRQCDSIKMDWTQLDPVSLLENVTKGWKRLSDLRDRLEIMSLLTQGMS